MSSLSLGDLAQTFMFQRRGLSLRTEMNRLADELASGQVSDVKTVLAGNVSYLADVERELRTLEGYRVAGTEATQYTDAVQNVLERIADASGGLGASLVALTEQSSSPLVSQGVEEARNRAETVLSALNTNMAGRGLFGGTATDARAMGDVDTLLSGLEAAVVAAGAVTPADIRAAAQAWFDDPAGFRATMYGGSDDGFAPFRLSKDESVRVDIRADDQVFREILMNSAVAALAESPALALDVPSARALQREAGLALVGGQDAIIGMRGSVGAAQARIDALTTRNASERTSLEFARNELLAVDPFETATRLEDVQFRLESLYTVTARMADLTLVNYIR